MADIVAFSLDDKKHSICWITSLYGKSFNQLSSKGNSDNDNAVTPRKRRHAKR